MIYTSEVDYDLTTQDSEEIKSKFCIVLENARKGIRMEHIFTDNLKDEKLPKQKVAIGKTRIFCGAPLVYVLACRAAFGAFMSYVKRHCVDTGTAIGLNPFSQDWDYVAKLLISKAGSPLYESYGAGDYSRYDGSELPYIHWLILDIINRWYGGSAEESLMRRTLWLDLINSYHVKDGYAYSWNASLPSGHPLTSIVNSMYNHIAMGYCFEKLARLHDFGGNFYDHVYLVVMGDDNLFSVTGECKFFNETNIAKYMKDLGLTYTSDTKAGTNDGLRNLYSVTFLKRSFRLEKDIEFPTLWNKFCAPEDLDVVLEIPFWYTKSKTSPETILKQNVETCLKELSLHGKDIYNYWAPRVIKAYKGRASANPFDELNFTTYATARIAVVSDQYIW